MNRILIDAETYQAILAKHPHVEVELLRTTVPMVVEMLKKKIEEKEGNWTQQVEKAIRRIESEMGSRWRFPPEVKGVLKQVMKDDIFPTMKPDFMALAEDVVGKTAKAQIDSLVTKTKVDLKGAEAHIIDRINAYAKEAAEREVMALLRAGKLTVAP
jgi:hypothetical protein